MFFGHFDGGSCKDLATTYAVIPRYISILFSKIIFTTCLVLTVDTLEKMTLYPLFTLTQLGGYAVIT